MRQHKRLVLSVVIDGNGRLFPDFSYSNSYPCPYLHFTQKGQVLLPFFVS